MGKQTQLPVFPPLLTPEIIYFNCIEPYKNVYIHTYQNQFKSFLIIFF